MYPGQISSNAINLNFGESDSEHQFDYYELVFTSPTEILNNKLHKEKIEQSKNITKKLEKNDS